MMAKFYPAQNKCDKSYMLNLVLEEIP